MNTFFLTKRKPFRAQCMPPIPLYNSRIRSFDFTEDMFDAMLDSTMTLRSIISLVSCFPVANENRSYNSCIEIGFVDIMAAGLRG